MTVLCSELIMVPHFRVCLLNGEESLFIRATEENGKWQTHR